MTGATTLLIANPGINPNVKKFQIFPIRGILAMLTLMFSVSIKGASIRVLNTKALKKLSWVRFCKLSGTLVKLNLSTNSTTLCWSSNIWKYSFPAVLIVSPVNSDQFVAKFVSQNGNRDLAGLVGVVLVLSLVIPPKMVAFAKLS